MATSRKMVEVNVPGALGGRLKLAGVSARATYKNVMMRFHQSALYRWRYTGPIPERLLIAPPDVRTADPTTANEIIDGTFVFAGRVVEAFDVSPFLLPPPTLEWEKKLNSFSWLRHLKASDNPDARLVAQELIEDWIAIKGKWDDVAWDVDVTATRVLSWLAQSPTILQGAEGNFYNSFMRSLARQVRYLRRMSNDLPPGLLRLKVSIVLVAAALSVSGQKRFVRTSARRLDEELNSQILPDGGHISRSPAALIAILTDLLPVRQAFTARGLEPTKAVLTAIDRIMPMMRFFRHGDGAFAHFNGMGGTKSDLLATLLAYDDARGKPVLDAKHSGYSRMETEGAIVIADTGGAPPLRLSQDAHAGCLSFEFSSNRKRIITNCGAPVSHLNDWKQITRASAAHSTLILNDTSSCRFLSDPEKQKKLGPVILSGPEDVRSRLFNSERGLEMVMSHDGYATSFGLVHERTLMLEHNGKSLFGVDTLTGRPVRGYAEFAIRFHIHPSIVAHLTNNDEGVFMSLDNEEAWEFEASPGVDLALEESIYMSETYGHRRCQQIVLYGNALEINSVTWSFVQSGSFRSRPLFDEDMKAAQDDIRYADE